MGKLTNEMDSAERELGSGWISGMTSVVLAVIGLATVLCLLYPGLFTVADVRGYYNVGLIRIAVHIVLIAAFAFGAVSVSLRQSKLLGFTGMTLVLVAALMGGSRASTKMEDHTDIYFGLDFFLLNLIFLGVIFIPIERLFKKREQPIFREDWREDLFYFFVSSLFVQSMAYLSLRPSMTALEKHTAHNYSGDQAVIDALKKALSPQTLLELQKREVGVPITIVG